jgi:endonuclease-3
MAANKAYKILARLQKAFVNPEWVKSKRDSFKTLIVTIISQNTADRNKARAFENLSKQFGITPEVLANADTAKIEQCLKTAGLYRNKAKTIKQVSRRILEELNGELDQILSLPLEEARNRLMEFPGIGPKTADAVLLFSAKRRTIPVDTHVDRVAKRLGLAPLNSDYDAVRESLQSLYDPKDYLAVHVLLIAHGRKYCKARKPLCKDCPVCVSCPSRQASCDQDG